MKQATINASNGRVVYVSKEEFIPIEKDKDGFATEECRSDMADNVPFLLKDNEGYIEVAYEVDNDVNKKRYTHWRPVNRK